MSNNSANIKEGSYHSAAEVTGETFTRITQAMTRIVIEDQAKLGQLRAFKKKKQAGL